MVAADINIDKMDMWCQDEVRMGQRGSVTRMWAEKGTRPRVLRQQEFEYVYLFEAVCLARDEGVGLVISVINTEAILIPLEHTSAQILT